MMARKTRLTLLNLPTQGVILMVFIVVLTSCAIGIPGIWLIRIQLDRQAWELVKQGDQMIEVLLDARVNDLSNLAILTAQRPTLARLLAAGDQNELGSYLEILRSGARLDMVMICNYRLGEPLIQVGVEIPPEACQTVSMNIFFQSSAGAETPGWLLAYQPVASDPTSVVVVGQAFNPGFSMQLKEQIGMELLLVFNDELIGGGFTNNSRIWNSLASQTSLDSGLIDHTQTERVTLDSNQYYISRSRYRDTGLETIALLPGTIIADTQQQLTRTATAVILVVILFSSLLAILLTRRISRPLEHLRDSAIALRQGNLSTPVRAKTRVREIAEVTYALEDARIALQHSLEELRHEKAWGDYLLESVVEGIITIDRKKRITFFSHGAERITGWNQERVLGKTIDELFRLTDREAHFSQRIPLPGKKPEIVTILINERPLTLAISGARLTPPEAGKANVAISIRDVSNEEAMRGLLGDFLANITHEFRTPLTALAVSIELLMDQLPELTMDEIYELLISNRVGVLSLQNLIDNVLEGASIEAGRFRVSPRPTELVDVITEATSMMRPLMERNHHHLQINLPDNLPLVLADPRRTSQVLVNFLSNAIKWGPPDSDIFLQVTSTPRVVKISVADQGPGIMPEQKSRLFTRFGHLHMENGRAEYGAGLGLSVVKAIVESQHGRVGVEDREGGGAVFWFTVPTVDLKSSEEEDDL